MRGDETAAPEALVARLRAAGCVFAEEEAALLSAGARDDAEREAMARRREDGEPLEHVLGWAEFAGLRITVAPGVFVPRRRTEFLVACALDGLRPGAVVVDVCCGAGAVGAALLDARPDLSLHATDLSPAAVTCARRTLPAAVGVHLGDLLAGLPGELAGHVDLLVASTPYVPSDAVAGMPPEARDHEPRLALDGGADGLDVVRRLAEAAQAWLVPGGRLLVECAEHQAAIARAVLADAGLAATTAHDDDRDATVVSGRV